MAALVFVAARRLSLVAVSWGYSSLRCTGFPLLWLLLLRSMGSRCAGFSSCGSRALERRLSSVCMGLVALWHVGSSRTRARTRVPCISRWILNHCATREALKSFSKLVTKAESQRPLPRHMFLDFFEIIIKMKA